MDKVIRYLIPSFPMKTPSSLMNTHFSPQLGQTIKDDRYVILRKLGEGTTSSTWLVKDSLANPTKYLAAKILTAEASRDPGPLAEIEFLRAIGHHETTNPDDEGLEFLPEHFDSFTLTINTPQSSPRHHVCLIIPLFSTSVSALRRSAPMKCLPVYMVKSIIYMMLQALKTIHSLGIIHTDVKLDNLLFANHKFFRDEDLEEYLVKHPTHNNSNGLPAVQPIPCEWTYDTKAFDAERMSVYLIDFGHAEWVHQPPKAQLFCAPSLRPPEVILDAGFSTAIDIWAIGCLTFELLVGCWLFAPESALFGWSIEDDHLAKMLELTGQKCFPKSVLDQAKLRDRYLNKDGTLKRIPRLIPVTIEKAMSNYNIPGLEERDIQEAADFIRSCLNLDGAQRKTAAELLQHSFPLGAFSC